MGKMNMGRVVLGGIVAGIVADFLAFCIEGMLLGQRWAAGMTALGRHPFSIKQVMAFNVLGLITGIVAVWLYAAIRPRFGAGVKTAITAGLVVWILGYLVPNLALMYVPHLFSRHLTLYTTLGGLVEIVVATVAGAAVYKEAGVAAQSAATAETPRQAVRA